MAISVTDAAKFLRSGVISTATLVVPDRGVGSLLAVTLVNQRLGQLTRAIDQAVAAADARLEKTRRQREESERNAARRTRAQAKFADEQDDGSEGSGGPGGKRSGGGEGGGGEGWGGFVAGALEGFGFFETLKKGTALLRAATRKLPGIMGLAIGAAGIYSDVSQGSDIDLLNAALTGASAGGLIGSMFGGVGAAPGAIIGGAAGVAGGVIYNARGTLGAMFADWGNEISREAARLKGLATDAWDATVKTWDSSTAFLSSSIHTGWKRLTDTTVEYADKAETWFRSQGSNLSLWFDSIVEKMRSYVNSFELKRIAADWLNHLTMWVKNKFSLFGSGSASKPEGPNGGSYTDEFGQTFSTPGGGSGGGGEGGGGSGGMGNGGAPPTAPLGSGSVTPKLTGTGAREPSSWNAPTNTPTSGSPSYDAMYKQASVNSKTWGDPNINPQYGPNTYQHACLRGATGVISALTGDKSLMIPSGGDAGTYSQGNRFLQRSGKYEEAQALPTNYKNDPTQWRIGDVVSASRNGSSSGGHIQVYDGRNWVSDAKQTQGILGGYDPDSYMLHRANAAGVASFNPDYVRENDTNGATSAYIREHSAEITKARQGAVATSAPAASVSTPSVDSGATNSANAPASPAASAAPATSRPRREALVAMGTNNWDANAGPGAQADIERQLADLKSKGYSPTVITPNPRVHNLTVAYDAAVAAAKAAGVPYETPRVWDSNISYHIDPAEAARIKAAHPGALAVGDSNAVLLGAKEGVTGFTSARTDFINTHAQIAPFEQTQSGPFTATDSKGLPTQAEATPSSQTSPVAPTMSYDVGGPGVSAIPETVPQTTSVSEARGESATMHHEDQESAPSAAKPTPVEYPDRGMHIDWMSKIPSVPPDVHLAVKLYSDNH